MRGHFIKTRHSSIDDKNAFVSQNNMRMTWLMNIVPFLSDISPRLTLIHNRPPLHTKADSLHLNNSDLISLRTGGKKEVKCCPIGRISVWWRHAHRQHHLREKEQLVEKSIFNDTQCCLCVFTGITAGRADDYWPCQRHDRSVALADAIYRDKNTPHIFKKGGVNHWDTTF